MKWMLQSVAKRQEDNQSNPNPIQSSNDNSLARTKTLFLQYSALNRISNKIKQRKLSGKCFLINILRIKAHSKKKLHLSSTQTKKNLYLVEILMNLGFLLLSSRLQRTVKRNKKKMNKLHFIERHSQPAVTQLKHIANILHSLLLMLPPISMMSLQSARNRILGIQIHRKITQFSRCSLRFLCRRSFVSTNFFPSPPLRRLQKMTAPLGVGKPTQLETGSDALTDDAGPQR